MSQVWLVTGAGRGLGMAITQAALEAPLAPIPRPRRSAWAALSTPAARDVLGANYAGCG
jgi:NAD(P)-dependent dehydrogenase (short-subunit alcohol dehydrogenase family)